MAKYLDDTALAELVSKIKVLVNTKQDEITSTNKLDYSLIANTPTIPTVNNATLTVQLNGSTIDTFTANASSNKTINVKALPNYSLSIGSTNGGNPRQVLFCTVNYTNFGSESGAYFKLGAMSGHGNGSSYTFVEDIFINVNYQGTVTCQVYKYVQAAAGNVDSVARNYGDVFYVIDTTNKIVYFYILMGQYSSAQFTPGTKIGAARAVTAANGITQPTGTPTYYSSGTKVWATGDGATYVRSDELPNVSNFLDKTGDTITGNIKLNGGAITTNDSYNIFRVYNNKVQIGSSSKTTEFLSRPQYNSTNFALATDSAPSIVYTTTAPSVANTSGLKIALLDSEPSTKYDGWVYLIKE